MSKWPPVKEQGETGAFTTEVPSQKPRKSELRLDEYFTLSADEATNRVFVDPTFVKKAKALEFAFEKQAAGTQPSKMSYINQGDREFYSTEALKQRESLFLNNKIRKNILMFWHTCTHQKWPKSIYKRYKEQIDGDLLDLNDRFARELANHPSSHAKARRGTPGKVSEADTKRLEKFQVDLNKKAINPREYVGKGEYIQILVLIQKAVLPAKMFSYKKAIRVAKEDWARDTAGLPSEMQGLSWPRLYACIYELVDTWTTSLDEEEYIEFLQQLYIRVTNPRNENGDPPPGYTEPAQFQWRSVTEVTPIEPKEETASETTTEVTIDPAALVLLEHEKKNRAANERRSIC
jgi:hypothetical protein